MLINIRKVKNHSKVHCNIDNIVVDKMGDLPRHEPVWYYPETIANILSMFLVARKFHVQYDSRDGGDFIVWKDDGTCRSFIPGSKGVYYSNFKECNENILVGNGEPEAVNTVEGNLEHFDKQQIKEQTPDDSRTQQD